MNNAPSNYIGLESVAAQQRNLRDSDTRTWPICGIMWPCIGWGDIWPTPCGGEGCRMWAAFCNTTPATTANNAQAQPRTPAFTAQQLSVR